jgi:TolB protein
MELSDLAWAPDGQRLAFVQETRKGLADIHVLDLRSGRDARLTEGHTSQEPSWSPDGTRLACLSDREGAPQVFILAGDGSHAEQLTRDPAPKGRVAWSASGARGDRIGYSARVDGRSCLFTLAPDGGDRQQVWSGPEPVASLCWAPDARSLLLGLAAGAGTRLRIASLDGKLQELGANLDGGQTPQWVQNAAPVPMPARPLTDRFTPYQVPAILGAGPLR